MNESRNTDTTTPERFVAIPIRPSDSGDHGPLLVLVERLVPADIREALVGDLLEERFERAMRFGPSAASYWFYRQVGGVLVFAVKNAVAGCFGRLASTALRLALASAKLK